MGSMEKELAMSAPDKKLSAWDGFKQGKWTREINVREFIQENFTPYTGDSTFLAPTTPRTDELWGQVKELMKEEIKKGILDVETKIIAGIDASGPGYINQGLEQIVGLQTDAPLKRAIMPFGGIRTVQSALKAYGREMDPETARVFKYRKTHNDGVFDAYTKKMMAVRSSGIITGLPDAYGRGRIIGDYRRVALYGVDRLIEDKKAQLVSLDFDVMDSETIQKREETAEQIRALKELITMAKSYGFDISQPAGNGKEAIQWTYFAYLGAIKEQDGAAMSLGRVSTFLDIYIQRDLNSGALDESAAQELIDHFVMKLRMVRFLRPPAYNALFSGDPTWVTEALGGMSQDGVPMVTKTSYRFLHTKKLCKLILELANQSPAGNPFAVQ